MLNKFKKLITKTPPPNIDKTIERIKMELSEGLFNRLEDSFTDRLKNEVNSSYGPQDAQEIIDGYAQKNLILAAATSIVPGPLGILGAVPELLLNFSNQMGMIYDLSCAYDKESFINKDLLLDIPLAAFGANTDLASLQNAQNLVNSPTELLQAKAMDLGQALVNRTLKKSIVQFIPVGGSVLMATWAKMATKKVSKGALLFLDNKEVYTEHFKQEENEATDLLIQEEKIKGLINLIEANNTFNEDQIDLITTIINNAELDPERRAYYLEEALKPNSQLALDHQILIDFEEADDLIMEMIVMAKRSGSVDKYEEEYIYQIASDLNLEEEFVTDLIN